MTAARGSATCRSRYAAAFLALARRARAQLVDDSPGSLEFAGGHRDLAVADLEVGSGHRVDLAGRCDARPRELARELERRGRRPAGMAAASGPVEQVAVDAP